MGARYLLREASEPATGDTIPFSRTPTPGGIQIYDSTGLGRLDFCATWHMTAVPFGASDAKLTGLGTYPQFVVPAGWTAKLFLMTVQTFDDGTDITSCAIRLWVNNNDVSSSTPPTSNYVEVVPDNNGAVRGSTALITASGQSSPYSVSTSSVAESYFDPRVTTNGSAGTMNVLVRIHGYLYPNT